MATPSAIVSVSLDTSKIPAQFQKAIQRAQASVKPISLKIDSAPLGRFGKDLKEFDKSLEAANARVIAFSSSVGVLYGMTSAFRALVRETINVEKSLIDINSILNASNKSFNTFTKGLFDAAAQAGKSFSEAADAANEFARQGLGIEETLKRTKDALILSRIAALSSTEAVTDLTAAVNTFRDEVLDTTAVVQKMATVDAAFAVSSKDLANAISRAGAVAVDAKVNFDQLLAVVTSAQQTTARGGSVIGNALKTIFTRTERPKTLEALESIGVATKNIEGNVRPAIDILRDLAIQYKNLGDVQKSQIVSQVAGLHQVNIARAILSDLSRENSIYAAALDVSENSTNEATKRNEELNTSLSALINKVKVAGLAITNSIGQRAIEPALRSLLEAVDKNFERIQAFGESDSLGANIGKGILDGIASTLRGPGLTLVLGVVFKLFSRIVSDLTKATGTLTGLNEQSKSQAALQESINKILSGGNDIYRQRLAAAESLKAKETEILKILQQENALAQVRSVSGASVVAGLSARGYKVPNFSDGIQRAIERESKSVGRDNVYVDFDDRLKGPQNPLGILVANKRDEPLGGFQGVNRAIREGKNPRTYNIPNFAAPHPAILFNRLPNILSRSSFPDLERVIQREIIDSLKRIDISKIDFSKPREQIQKGFEKLIKNELGVGWMREIDFESSRRGLRLRSAIKDLVEKTYYLRESEINDIRRKQQDILDKRDFRKEDRLARERARNNEIISRSQSKIDIGELINSKERDQLYKALRTQNLREAQKKYGTEEVGLWSQNRINYLIDNPAKEMAGRMARESARENLKYRMGDFFAQGKSSLRLGFGTGTGFGIERAFNKEFGTDLFKNDRELQSLRADLLRDARTRRSAVLKQAGIGAALGAPIVGGALLNTIYDGRAMETRGGRTTSGIIEGASTGAMIGLLGGGGPPALAVGATIGVMISLKSVLENITESAESLNKRIAESVKERGEETQSIANVISAQDEYNRLIKSGASSSVIRRAGSVLESRISSLSPQTYQQFINARTDEQRQDLITERVIDDLAGSKLAEAAQSLNVRGAEKVNPFLNRAGAISAFDRDKDRGVFGSIRDFLARMSYSTTETIRNSDLEWYQRISPINFLEKIYENSRNITPESIRSRFDLTNPKIIRQEAGLISSIPLNQNLGEDFFSKLRDRLLNQKESPEEVIRTLLKNGRLNQEDVDKYVDSLSNLGPQELRQIATKSLENLSSRARERALAKERDKYNKSVVEFYKVSERILDDVARTFDVSSLKRASERNLAISKSTGLLDAYSTSLTPDRVQNFRNINERQSLESNLISNIESEIVKTLSSINLPDGFNTNKNILSAIQTIVQNPSRIYEQSNVIVDEIRKLKEGGDDDSMDKIPEAVEQLARNIERMGIAFENNIKELDLKDSIEKLKITLERQANFLGGDFTKIGNTNISDISRSFSGLRNLSRSGGSQNRFIRSSVSATELGDYLNQNQLLDDNTRKRFADIAAKGAAVAMNKQLDRLIKQAERIGDKELADSLRKQRENVDVSARRQAENRFQSRSGEDIAKAQYSAQQLNEIGMQNLAPVQANTKALLESTDAVRQLTDAFNKIPVLGGDVSPTPIKSAARGFIPNFNALIKEAIDIKNGVGGAKLFDKPQRKFINGLGNVVVNSGEKIVKNWNGTGKDAILNRNMQQMLGYASGFIPNFADTTPIFGKGIQNRLNDPDLLKIIELDGDFSGYYKSKGKYINALLNKIMVPLNNKLLKRKKHIPFNYGKNGLYDILEGVSGNKKSNSFYFSLGSEGGIDNIKSNFKKGNYIGAELRGVTKLGEAKGNPFLPNSETLYSALKRGGLNLSDIKGKSLPDNLILKPIRGLQSQGIVRPGGIIPNSIKNPSRYISQEAYPLNPQRSFSKEGLNLLGKIIKKPYLDYSNYFNFEEYRSHVATHGKNINTVRYSTANKNSPFRSLFPNFYESRKIKAIEEAARNSVSGIKNRLSGNQVFGVDVASIEPNFAREQNAKLGYDKFTSYRRGFLERLIRGNFKEKYGYFGGLELNPARNYAGQGASGNAGRPFEINAFLSGAKGKTPFYAIDQIPRNVLEYIKNPENIRKIAGGAKNLIKGGIIGAGTYTAGDISSRYVGNKIGGYAGEAISEIGKYGSTVAAGAVGGGGIGGAVFSAIAGLYSSGNNLIRRSYDGVFAWDDAIQSQKDLNRAYNRYNRWKNRKEQNRRNNIIAGAFNKSLSTFNQSDELLGYMKGTSPSVSLSSQDNTVDKELEELVNAELRKAREKSDLNYLGKRAEREGRIIYGSENTFGPKNNPYNGLSNNASIGRGITERERILNAIEEGRVSFSKGFIPNFSMLKTGRLTSRGLSSGAPRGEKKKGSKVLDIIDRNILNLIGISGDSNAFTMDIFSRLAGTDFAINDAIQRELDALKERGLSENYARGNIFIGSRPEIGGIGVGNYIDEPLGRTNPNLGILQGVNRVSKSGKNPRASGYVPNFANNDELVGIMRSLVDTLTQYNANVQSQGTNNQTLSSGVDVNQNINVSANVAVNGAVQSANENVQAIINDAISKLKADIENKLRSLQNTGRYTPTPTATNPIPSSPLLGGN